MRALFFVLSLVFVGCGDGGPMSADAGGLAFGATCTTDADCASNVCFMGGTKSFCSLHCTAATAATDCPVPPTSGMCNTMGFCK